MVLDNFIAAYRRELLRGCPVHMVVTAHIDTAERPATAVERVESVILAAIERGWPAGRFVSMPRDARFLLVQTGPNVREPQNRYVWLTSWTAHIGGEVQCRVNPPRSGLSDPNFSSPAWPFSCDLVLSSGERCAVGLNVKPGSVADREPEM
ncbi:MAG: hypothetical protein IPK81_00490 [Rhodospirillales bacterium]|nr:MAG: hypothetical protein IPK81_00490 [Rhodospirillales bacterium]